jgi:hypothetical protein
VDRTGRVRKIHSGFAGPGTGHHERLVAELTGLIEELRGTGCRRRAGLEARRAPRACDERARFHRRGRAAFNVGPAPLAIYYEHPRWFEPLFAELDRRGVPHLKLHSTSTLRPEPSGRRRPTSSSIA